MKTVFTFWPKPGTSAGNFYGYRLPVLMARAMELGMAYARRNGDGPCEVVTDERGRCLLEAMGVRPDRWSMGLERLNGLPKALWAYPKLVAMAEQSEPFIHQDYDVFLKERVDWRAVGRGAEVVFESGEWWHEGYSEAWKQIEDKCPVVPGGLEPGPSWNCGLVVGLDIEAVQRWARAAERFVECPENAAFWAARRGWSWGYNAILEQRLARVCVRGTALLRAEHRNFDAGAVGYVHYPGGHKRTVDREERIGRLLAEVSPEAFARTRAAARMPRVFGLGLSKTGTSSLTTALRWLGFSTAHSCRPGSGGAPLEVADAERFDALTDLPVAARWRELAERYPDALWVLTTRNVGAWLRSSAREFSREADRMRHPALREVVREVFGGYVFDKCRWREAYHRQRVLAREEIERRGGRVVEINLERGDGYAVLCRALGLPVPEGMDWPWENRWAGD